MKKVKKKCIFLLLLCYLIYINILKPAIAAMHGSHSVFSFGHREIIYSDAGGVSLVDQ